MGSNISSSDRLLDTLERLLEVPLGDLQSTLTHVSDVIAGATGAEKVDAFLYDAKRDSLVALGSSMQPLSMLQRKLGLDVLQVSNGGRAVHVYQSGEVFLNGYVELDEAELRGIKEGMGIRSTLGVPLEIGGKRRGMIMLASRSPEFFSEEDARFMTVVSRWVGAAAHRAELMSEIGRNAAEAGRRAGAEELVTVVAHDLRNHIAPIGLRLEILRRRAEQESRQSDVDDVKAAEASMARLASLVGEVLDVARIDRGMFELQARPLEVSAMVRDHAVRFDTPQHPVLVTVEAGDAIRVEADAQRLGQCLENIIANAIQKSPDGGVVNVFVTCDRPPATPLARVEVVDQGPGIPEDMLPHVFERFYTSRRSEGGLGLGLYMAKRIAMLHGGDLGVTSAPGSGARFTLTLPLLAEPR